ncbi:hypothetical protein BH18THE2_BH18THE2_31540 [soil metagenome]
MNEDLVKDQNIPNEVIGEKRNQSLSLSLAAFKDNL